jgi:DNA mismatch repair protein MutL
MTGKIKILDDTLINLIAAGEIVERPASVVKELLENSLDAGAESIDIEIASGGKKRIAVVDDGHGMTGEDARLALERHATSKIESFEDLQSIHTMGFRGEALPSIASVSRFTLFTRARKSEVGCEIHADGGVVKDSQDAGIPPGTRVIVEDLFYSVPARRKFLKTDRTEYYQILDVIHRVALSRPDVRFRLVSDGKEVTTMSPGSLRERAAGVFGRKVAERMEKLDFEEEGIRVTGLVGDPADTRSNQSNIFIYVNDRYVRDGMISASLLRAYTGLVFDRRYPMAVLFVQLPPGEVDVNIHPKKIYVKFREPNRVGGIVYRGIDAALRRSTRVTHVSPEGVSYQKNRVSTPMRTGSVRDVVSQYLKIGEMGEKDIGDRAQPSFLAPSIGVDTVIASPAPEDTVSWEGVRIVGQVHRMYIILETEESLVIIDQHAAHERIVFEALKKGAESNAIPIQKLLFPVKVELSPREYACVLQERDSFSRLGLEISDFGKDTVIVAALPSSLAEADVKDLVVDLIGEVLEEGAIRSGEKMRDRLLTVMACHGAVRAGEELNMEKIVALIRALSETPYAAHCPHGRPTQVVIPFSELNKNFKRTS